MTYKGTKPGGLPHTKNPSHTVLCRTSYKGPFAFLRN